MQLFEEYQKAKHKLLEYFAAPGGYQVNALLDAEWKYSWEDYALYWTDGVHGYENAVIGVYETDAYKMFLMYSGYGDKELVIFDKAKELKNAE